MCQHSTYSYIEVLLSHHNLEIPIGVVHTNVGQNVTLLTIPLRLFFTIFSTTTSS